MFRNVYNRIFRQRSGVWSLLTTENQTLILLKHLEDSQLTIRQVFTLSRLLVRTSLNVTVYKTKI